MSRRSTRRCWHHAEPTGILSKSASPTPPFSIWRPVIDPSLGMNGKIGFQITRQNLGIFVIGHKRPIWG
jgi:hypothetical protein